MAAVQRKLRKFNLVKIKAYMVLKVLDMVDSGLSAYANSVYQAVLPAHVNYRPDGLGMRLSQILHKSVIQVTPDPASVGGGACQPDSSKWYCCPFKQLSRLRHSSYGAICQI